MLVSALEGKYPESAPSSPQADTHSHHVTRMTTLCEQGERRRYLNCILTFTVDSTAPIEQISAFGISDPRRTNPDRGVQSVGLKLSEHVVSS
jgi:hypothetical protein